MAKVTAPLLSFGASGQIGKAQVYGRWRGVPYARQLVTPRNPQSTQQTSTRNVFSSISGLWKNMGSIAQSPWVRAIVGRPLTARNLVLSANIKAMRGEADREDFIGSPGAFGGPAPSAVSADAGSASGEIDVGITSPTAPTGWTLVAVQAFAMQDGDPADPVPLPIAEGQNESPTAGSEDTVTLTGLTDDALHVCVGWTKWTKPDGSFAYGASLLDTATPTSP